MVRVIEMIDEAIIGGGQIHVLSVAEHLDRSRFEPLVACSGEGFLVDELKKRSIPVVSVRMSNLPDPRNIAACVRLFRRTNPAIVHTHGGTAGFAARAASPFAPKSIRFVHTYHGMHYLHDLTSVRNKLFLGADRILTSRTDHFVCCAKSDYELGIKHGIVVAKNTSVVRSGVDVGKYGGPDRKSEKDRMIIGTIGRLHVQKGHRYLIEAAAEVIRHLPSALFRIVGEGELREDLVLQARRLGIMEQVEFPGARMDTEAFLKEIDIFVLPSLWEGLPIVLLEAMAASRPIVVTDVDGVSEAVTDGVHALLVPPGDSRSLALALLRVANDRSLARTLAGNARERVTAEFSTPVMISNLEKVYSTTLEHKR